MPPMGTGLQIAPAAQIRMTPGLAQAISLLALPAHRLEARLRIAAAENPALRLPPPALPIWGADPEGEAAAPSSLIGHVLERIALMRLAPRQEAIALALADALAPTGWLGTSTARLARDLGLAEAELLAVLERLQSIEPAGLFARSLSDCLTMQARAEGLLTPAMLAVLGGLALIAQGGTAALAHQTDLPEVDLARAFGQIRGFDPKPGLAFHSPLPPPPPPELVIRVQNGQWRAEMNPALGRAEALPDLPGSADAQAICRAIRGRIEIGLQLAQMLVAAQGAWLAGGALAPLTSRSLADQTGLHVATVNRSLAAIHARGPRGTLPLRAMVALPVGGISDDQLRHRMTALLQRPGPRPSDRQLAETLAEEGIHVARRTLAKYRAGLAVQNQPKSRHHR